jgi:hypothetical protein
MALRVATATLVDAGCPLGSPCKPLRFLFRFTMCVAAVPQITAGKNVMS